jgi:branched-chain amino acid transport system permease protein
MVAAFLYWQLHYAWGWPTPVALVVVLVVAGPLFGIALERLIMRRLEGTSEATRLVVTISLLLGLLGTAIAIWPPGENRPLRQFFQGNVIELGGVRIPWFEVVFLLVAVAVALGLRVLLHRTRAGLTMRAAVDDRALVTLTGARAERSSMLAWAIGCSLAALAGVLVAPTLTLSAVPLTLLIVNAYGAAVFGRLRSLPMTFVGGLVLGLVTSYGIAYLSDLPDGIEPYARGLVNATPAIVLFVVVLLLPTGRLGGVLRTREISVKPTWGGALTLAVGVVVVTAMLVPILGPGDLVSIGKVWGLAIVALSMVPLIGLSGQLSLAQLSFAGFGAVAYSHLGWHHPLGLVFAALVGALVATVVALPVVRLQGIYVALATAAFAVLCDRWLFGMPTFSIGTHEFTVFQGGALDMVRPELLGVDLSSPKAYFVFSSVVFASLSLVVAGVRRSRYGSRLIATKEGALAVATSGIDVTTTKLSVFALSGAIAGIGGAVMSGAEPANTGAFDFVAGLPLLLLMVLGGISSVGATIAAGVFLGSGLFGKVLAGVFDLGRWQNTLIGGGGVGVGNDPNGVTAQLRPISARVREDRLVLGVMLTALVGIWVLRVTDVVSNGPFVALVVVVLVATPVSVGLRQRDVPSAVEPVPPEHDHGPRGLSAPPELLGLSSPFTDRDVEVLDLTLDLTPATTVER